MDLTGYFNQHTTQRWIFKHGVVLAAGAGITLILMAISQGLIGPIWAGPITLACNWAAMQMKSLNPDLPWQGVGAKSR